MEVVEDRGALAFTGASHEVWSQGLPLRVNELIAHLHGNNEEFFRSRLATQEKNSVK